MRFILFSLLLSVSIVFSQGSGDNNKRVYQDLINYKHSGKHFELVLINKQYFYVSEIIELDSLNITINILNDRRMGINRNFQSLIEMEIENQYPKLLRKIKIENIYMVNKVKRSSIFDKIPYSPTTLIVIIPLVLLFIKFISATMVL